MKRLSLASADLSPHILSIADCSQPFLDISGSICLGDLSTSDELGKHQLETNHIKSAFIHSLIHNDILYGVYSRGLELLRLAVTRHYKAEADETEIKSASSYQETVKSIMKSLSLRSRDLVAKTRSISDCLQYFTRPEMLGHQYMCKTCTNDSSPSSHDLLQRDLILTPATKQTLIFNPPAVLVIHLKRFEMKGSKFEKRNNLIKFEELLDLAPFCSAWCQRNEGREQNIWYSLYAVVVHSGTLNSGHYVAYVKERIESKDVEQFLQKEYFDRDVTADQLVEMMKNLKQKGRPTISTQCSASQGIWYCMNDSHVSRVSVDEVLIKEAFLLFYERVSPVG